MDDKILPWRNFSAVCTVVAFIWVNSDHPVTQHCSSGRYFIVFTVNSTVLTV